MVQMNKYVYNDRQNLLNQRMNRVFHRNSSKWTFWLRTKMIFSWNKQKFSHRSTHFCHWFFIVHQIFGTNLKMSARKQQWLQHISIYQWFFFSVEFLRFHSKYHREKLCHHWKFFLDKLSLYYQSNVSKLVHQYMTKLYPIQIEWIELNFKKKNDRITSLCLSLSMDFAWDKTTWHNWQ